MRSLIHQRSSVAPDRAGKQIPPASIHPAIQHHFRTYHLPLDQPVSQLRDAVLSSVQEQRRHFGVHDALQYDYCRDRAYHSHYESGEAFGDVCKCEIEWDDAGQSRVKMHIVFWRGEKED